MRAIYEPAGRAREYAALACNLFRGCRHGCTYCWAPAVLRMRRDAYHGARAVRPGILAALARDAARLAGDPRRVLLCFTTDPYQHDSVADVEVVAEALAILHRHDLGVEVLTKAGAVAAGELHRLGTRDRAATTLTFWDPADAARWEPGAAPPEDRLDYLRVAKGLGLHTWVSLEPVIDPVQTLALIRRAAPYTDLFKVGTWNYDARARAIDWPRFAADAVALLERLGAAYYLKADLRRHLGEG